MPEHQSKAQIVQWIEEYQRLRSYMDRIPDLIVFKDEDHRYVRVNHAMADFLGTTPDRLVGHQASRFFPEPVASREHDEEQQVLTTEDPIRATVVEVEDLRGTRGWMSSTLIPWFDGSGTKVGTIRVMRDITAFQRDRQDAEVQRELKDVLYGLLDISLKDLPLSQKLELAIDRIVAVPWLALNQKGGIFLVDHTGKHLSLVATKNLPTELLEQCANVPFGRCLCGRAASERSLLFTQQIDDRHDVRYPEMQPHGHYCVPLISEHVLLGVLVLYVSAGHEPLPGEERYVRALAEALSGLVTRGLAAAAEQRALQVQGLLNEIVRISVEPLSLQQQLEQIVERIVAVPWVGLTPKGCIFLAEGDPPVLVMKAQRGLHPALLERCARVPIGHCLCGRAAATHQIVYRDCLDEDHEVRYAGIADHGHYCVPILSAERLLGVLNLYVPSHHQRAPREEDFLQAVANTLAGVIARKQAEQALRHVASYDSVTGLPNRVLFLKLLEQSLAAALRYGHGMALLFVDLDRFKSVNDTLGHDAGDGVLLEVGKRLKACLRDSDALSRFAGDEFTIALTHVDGPQYVDAVCSRIIEEIGRPVVVKGHECRVGASVGISLVPSDGTDVGALLNAADQAMYEAKKAGGSRYARHGGGALTPG